jgi:hypothetical protein
LKRFRPAANSAAPTARRACGGGTDLVVTRIRTDQGAEGYCFNSVSGTSPANVANVILEEIAPATIGPMSKSTASVE